VVSTSANSTSDLVYVRILITGSRHYQMEAHVRHVLDVELAWCGAITVVHGDNRSPDGADFFAARWAEEAAAAGRPVIPDPCPARWFDPCRPTCQPGHRRDSHGQVETICPAQGNYRNQEMVDLGAVRCHAFFQAGRVGLGGTGDCARRAAGAGIRVVLWEAGKQVIGTTGECLF
jgi:YspA, cpYpsA-related SLOG family